VGAGGNGSWILTALMNSAQVCVCRQLSRMFRSADDPVDANKTHLIQSTTNLHCSACSRMMHAHFKGDSAALQFSDACASEHR
jgi:hypothetical protein